MHLRRHFLEQIQAQLKTINNIGGVWIQRIFPTRIAYPSVTLYAEQETIQLATINQLPREQDRTLTISITGWVKGTADDQQAEKDMDKLAVLIESVVKLPTDAQDIVLDSTSFQVDEEEAEVHAVTLNYTLRYQSNEFTPTI